MWRDQPNCILHCCRENEFVADGLVSLKETHTLLSVDEKLGEKKKDLPKKRMQPWLCAENILDR